MPFEARIELDELAIGLDELQELPNEERSPEQHEELERLIDLRDELGHYEWNSGATLVHESELESIASEIIATFELPSFISDLLDSEVVAERIEREWTAVTYGSECYYVAEDA